MKKINFAIFGCGVISRFHAKALSMVEEANLVGCSDVNLPAATAFAEECDITVYPDFDALLNAPEVDVVNICTPNGTHAELAIKALEAGKNVVLEKPMAITTAECDKIIDVARTSKGKITVISQIRTAPDVIRAREIINSGILGKIVFAELNMRYYRKPEYYNGSWRGTKKMDGGGALMNQGIHGVDMIQYLVGPVKNIRSIVRTLAHDIEVEDMAVAALEYVSGALGVIIASTATHPGFDREIRVHGTKGSIEFTEGTIVKFIIDGVEQPCDTSALISGGASDNTKIEADGHARQFKTFIDVINGKDVPYVDEHEGKKAVEIIETIYNVTI